MKETRNQSNFYKILFGGLTKTEKVHLISQCLEKTYKKGDVIFAANERRDGLFLVCEGTAEVFIATDRGGSEDCEVLEIIQKGEMIGFSGLADFLEGMDSEQTGRRETVGGEGSEQTGPRQPVRNLESVRSAQVRSEEKMLEVLAMEEVSGLLIPFSVLKQRWHDPKVRDSFLHHVATRLEDVYTSLAEQVKHARSYGETGRMALRVQEIMSAPALIGDADISIRHAAEQMTRAKTSSIILTKHDKLVGIVTEKDLVNRVIARNVSYNQPVATIMTGSPITVSRFSYYGEALSTMVLKGVKHLPVIDGEAVVGVVTLADLMRKGNASMIRPIQQIETADESTLPQIKQAIYDVLQTMRREQIPIMTVLDVMTSLYDRLVNRAVQLTIERVGTPPIPFCLYQMGSSGRGEQFLLTDQDHFLVYGDEGEGEGHSTVRSVVAEYFSRFSKELVQILEQAGYAKCKGNMMSSNPDWRGSLADWDERFRLWTLQATNHTLMLAQTFFSYRRVFGDEAVHTTFENNIKAKLDRSKIFLYRLAQIEKENSVPDFGQPLRALFGLSRKQIDIKKKILFPFHHSLQIIGLAKGVISGTPAERLAELTRLHVISPDFAEDLEAALNHVMTLYVNWKLEQVERGEPNTSVLPLTQLTTRQKEELSLSLDTIRELQNQMFFSVGL